MAITRFQVKMGADTPLPRDQFVNVLHFDAGTIVGTDEEALCNDLADIYAAFWSSPNREIKVTAYSVGPAPNPPLASATRNSGMFPASTSPREVALCLSFRGAVNQPRHRGRIYMPAVRWPSSAWGLRPDVAFRNELLGLASQFADLGGTDVDWGVYSPSDGLLRPVQLAWVDDEWDIMRSRGLRSTSRVQSTHGE